MTRAQTFATAMQKGGVGKTTTTLNLADCLARAGARVLAVDLDPQANLTSGLGIDPETSEYSVYEALLNADQGAAFAIVDTAHGDGRLHLLPARLSLAGAELELAGRVGREMLLREALDPVAGDYDYILIDPPPSLGLFTANALAAADGVIVPVQLHAYALRALPQLHATMDLVRRLNRDLTLGGLILTMANRTNLAAAVEQSARSEYGDLVFRQTVPQNVRLAEAPAAGQPIVAYAAGSPGAAAYQAIATEFLERFPYAQR